MKRSLILLSFIKIQEGGLTGLDQLTWNDPLNTSSGCLPSRQNIYSART